MRVDGVGPASIVEVSFQEINITGNYTVCALCLPSDVVVILTWTLLVLLVAGLCYMYHYYQMLTTVSIQLDLSTLTLGPGPDNIFSDLYRLPLNGCPLN